MKLSDFNATILLIAAAITFAPTNGFVNNPSSRHISSRRQVVPSIHHFPSIQVLRRSNLVELKASEVSDAPKETSPFARLERKRRLAFGMAFLTGISDLALNMKYKCFATMMTGNTMWMALAMIEQRFMDVGFYASVIFSYLAGLTVFRRSDLALKKKTLPLSAFLVAGLFVGSDVMFSIFQSRWIPTMMLAMGFGIVNSVGQEVTGTLTFVVTGHLTRMMNQIIDRASRTAGRKKFTLADKQGLVLNASIFVGFFCGAAAAGVLKAKGILANKLGVFSGIGLGYAVLFLWKDMESLGGAWWKRKSGAMCDVDDDGAVCPDDQLEDTTTNGLEVSP